MTFTPIDIMDSFANETACRPRLTTFNHRWTARSMFWSASSDRELGEAKEARCRAMRIKITRNLGLETLQGIYESAISYPQESNIWPVDDGGLFRQILDGSG